MALRHVTLTLALTLVSACITSEAPPPPPPSRPSPPPPTSGPPPEPWQPEEPVPPSHERRPALPIYGGHGLVANDHLYMADPERDLVFRYHAVEGIPVENGRRVLPSASTPFRLADVNGEVHVTLRGAGAVARLSAGLERIEGTYTPCAAPRGIAWDAANERVLVACAGGELVATDAAGAELARVLLEPDLRDVVVDQTGAVFVSVFRAAEVIELDADLAVRARHELPDERATDPHAQALQSEDRAANTAWRMRAVDGGGVEVLHQLSTRAAAVPDSMPSRTEPAGYGPIGSEPTCDRPVVSNAISRLSPDGTITLERIGGGKLLVDFVRQSGVAYVASANTLSGENVFRVETIAVHTSSEVEECVGLAPNGNFAGSVGLSVEAYRGLIAAYARESGLLTLRRIVQDRVEVLPGVEDDGHTLFHQAAGVDITCASCHAEGRDDGLVWDFGDGPRRTQSLLGGVGATAPFHWKGDIGTMVEIMDRTFVTQMGGSVRGVAHAPDVESWLDTLPVEAATADPAAASRGFEVFVSAGCGSCHVGDFGTQPGSVVIDGEAWQVPMLRGVGLRSPYFHDGCAPSLHVALEGCEGRPPHPGTEALTETEREELAAFLAAWE